MRESFIIHSEYIEDLPEEYKNIFLVYIYDYGIKGITPNLTSLEKSLWIKIQRRIDSDIAAWNETKQAKSNAGKKHTGNQYTRKKAMEQMEQCSNNSKPMEQDGTNGTVSVFVSESVSDCVSVNDYELPSAGIPALDYKTTEKPYSNFIFNLYKELGLPNCNGNEYLWTSTEFSPAYDIISTRYKGLHSSDLFQAIRNYNSILKDERVYDGFKKRVRALKSFVEWDRFTDFLPGNFDINNFINWSEQKPEKKTVGANRAIELLREVQNEQKRIPE